jgi:hypothetical protein
MGLFTSAPTVVCVLTNLTSTPSVVICVLPRHFRSLCPLKISLFIAVACVLTCHQNSKSCSQNFQNEKCLFKISLSHCGSCPHEPHLISNLSSNLSREKYLFFIAVACVLTRHQNSKSCSQNFQNEKCLFKISLSHSGSCPHEPHLFSNPPSVCVFMNHTCTQILLQIYQEKNIYFLSPWRVSSLATKIPNPVLKIFKMKNAFSKY